MLFFFFKFVYEKNLPATLVDGRKALIIIILKY